MRPSKLLAPFLCGLAGLAYGILDWAYLDRLPESSPALLAGLDKFVDLVWPVLFGIGVGFGINLLRRQRRLNRQLSVENLHLERHLLTNVLISQLLHDIRNPIHNLAAALEGSAEPITENRRQIIRRNVEHLERVASQLSRWGAVYDTVDPEEPVALDRWLKRFVEDQAGSKFRRLGVHYSEQLEPLTVRMHPLLLEQVFVTLFNNACEAVERAQGPRRISLSTGPEAGPEGRLEIRLANTGAFPPEVLEAQGGSPVSSQSGLGLGLLLTRKLLEQVGGTMTLRNEAGQAVVVLRLPGERP